MSYKANFFIAQQSNWVLPGSGSNDLLLAVGHSNQNIVIGVSNVVNNMTIQGNGYVGIGKSNPAYVLDVAGDLNFSGTLRQAGVAWAPSTGGSGGGTAGVADVVDNSNIQNTANLHVMLNGSVGSNQQAVWGVAVDGTGTENAYSVAVDSSGNVYVAGYYSSGTPTIYNANSTTSSIPALRSSSGGDAAYLVKYNTAGVAQWAVSVDGTSGDQAKAVAVDSSGNVYLAGYYDIVAATVYNAANSNSALPALRVPSGASTGTAAFIVKWNSLGVAQWHASVDSTNGDISYGLAVDGSGNVYMAGVYSATAATVYDANNSNSALPTLRATTGDIASFVVKWNSLGVAQWHASVDGAGADSGNGVAVDASGNVYFAGRYQTVASTTVYNSNNSISSLPALRATNGNAAFVVKYDSTGVAQWHTSLDGSGDDQGMGIAVDASGNVYLAALYATGALTIYNAGNSNSALSALRAPSASWAAAVVKWNSSGIAQWGASVDSSGDDRGFGVAADTLGNVYLAGYYNGAVTIYNSNNSKSEKALFTSVGQGAFLVKYNSSGACTSAVCVDGTGTEAGNSVAVDSLGNAYLAGNYATAAPIIYNPDIKTQTVATLPAPSGQAAFCVKYNLGELPTYNIASSLSTTDNGLIKTVVNVSSSPAVVNIADSNLASTLATALLPAKYAQQYLWYGSNWYPFGTGTTYLTQNITNGYTSFRNRIINGDMRIAQRGTSVVTATGSATSYSLDRWFVSYNITTGGLTQSQQTLATTDSPYAAGFKYSYRVAASTACSSYANINPSQVIEGLNIADLNWGQTFGSTVTLSFWLKTNAAAGSVVAVTLRNDGSTYTYNTPITINVSGVWQYVTLSIPAPPSGSAWLTDTGVGIRLIIGGYYGAGLSSAPNTWQSGNYIGTSATTNIWATLNNYIEFTGVQLEKSVIATPFEFRPYATELDLCYRYFQRISNDSTYYVKFGNGMTYSTTAAIIQLLGFIPNKLRTTPTLATSASSTFYATNGATNYTLSSGLTLDWSSKSCVSLTVNSTYASASIPIVLLATATNGILAYIDLSAEL